MSLLHTLYTSVCRACSLVLSPPPFYRAPGIVHIRVCEGQEQGRKVVTGKDKDLGLTRKSRGYGGGSSHSQTRKSAPGSKAASRYASLAGKPSGPDGQQSNSQSVVGRVELAVSLLTFAADLASPSAEPASRSAGAHSRECKGEVPMEDGDNTQPSAPAPSGEASTPDEQEQQAQQLESTTGPQIASVNGGEMHRVDAGPDGRHDAWLLQLQDLVGITWTNSLRVTCRMVCVYVCARERVCPPCAFIDPSLALSSYLFPSNPHRLSRACVLSGVGRRKRDTTAAQDVPPIAREMCPPMGARQHTVLSHRAAAAKGHAIRRQTDCALPFRCACVVLAHRIFASQMCAHMHGSAREQISAYARVHVHFLRIHMHAHSHRRRVRTGGKVSGGARVVGVGCVRKVEAGVHARQGVAIMRCLCERDASSEPSQLFVLVHAFATDTTVSDKKNLTRLIWVV